MKGKSLPEKMIFSVPRGFMEMHIMRILGRPHHGYEIIKHIKQECAYWKPSPGSVYPMLSKLKKSGLITEKTVGNRNVYVLTRLGKERIKKFDSYKDEIKEKMISMFRMIGEDHNISDFKTGFEIFDKIKKDPEKMKKAAELREKFHRQMMELAEE